MNLRIGGLAAVVLLGACTADTASPPSTSMAGQISEESSARTTTTIDATDPEFQNAEIVSPLEQRLGLPATPAEWAEQYQEAENGYQEYISACIRTEGFEYFIYGGYEPPTVEDITVAAFAPVDELRQEGYGVTATLEASLPFLIDPDYRPEGESALGDYFQTLTEDEQQAFTKVYDRCNQEAQEVSPAVGNEFPEELRDEFEELWYTSTQGPESVAVWDEWQQCMREKGYDTNDRDGLTTELHEEAADVQEEAIRTKRVTDSMVERLDQLRDSELRIAGHDADCSEGIQLIQRLQEIQYRYETEWLKENESRMALLLGEG